MVKELKADKKEVPIGVKVISVFYLLGTIVPLFYWYVATSLGGPGIESLIVFGITVVPLIIIGTSLWKGQKWARIVAILFAILGTIISLLAIITPDYISVYISFYYRLIAYILPIGSILEGPYSEGNIGAIVTGLVINLVIAIYLLFNKDVKSTFK